jgi:hypothetical protein
MAEGNPFVGRWTYRTFQNDPELSTDFNDLRFGAGTLELDEPAYGRLSGSLGGEGWSLIISQPRVEPGMQGVDDPPHRHAH